MYEKDTKLMGIIRIENQWDYEGMITNENIKNSKPMKLWKITILRLWRIVNKWEFKRLSTIWNIKYKRLRRFDNKLEYM